MPTTPTLDDDVAAKPTTEAPRARRAFREIVNETLRRELESRRATAQRPAFKVTVRDLGNLNPGLSLDNMAELIEHVGPAPPVILVDANLLLYAYHPRAQQHEESRAWLEVVLSGPDLVRFAWLTLWAFLRIATNPRVFERPLSTTEAEAAISSWLYQPPAGILDPRDPPSDILRALVPPLHAPLRPIGKETPGNPRGRPRGIPNPQGRVPALVARRLSAQAPSDLIDRKPHLLRPLAAQLLPPPLACIDPAERLGIDLSSLRTVEDFRQVLSTVLAAVSRAERSRPPRARASHGGGLPHLAPFPPASRSS